MVAECEAALGPHRRGVLAIELGVSVESLDSPACWVEFATSLVHVSDGGRRVHLSGRPTSIDDGRKWSVKGGREGLFVAEMVAGNPHRNVPFDAADAVADC